MDTKKTANNLRRYSHCRTKRKNNSIPNYIHKISCSQSIKFILIAIYSILSSASPNFKVQSKIIQPRNDNFFWTNSFVTDKENTRLREQVKEMFNHAYFSYKNNAFPEDELMPVSCKGRRRGREKDRGDIDDILGNYTLTLIDTLDTLPLYGLWDEFNDGVRYASEQISFNSKLIVSVFESNIRIIGGLVGAHTMIQKIKSNSQSNKISPEIKNKFSWYDKQLITKAQILADKLLTSFDTETGLPRSRISLSSKSHGTSKISSDQKKSTCTACAGTLIMEFAALSHYSGDPKYEKAAMKVLEFLWRRKNLATSLVGQVINVENGNWVRSEAGIGAGTDSYYEYLYKGAVMLNDGELMDRFKIHYESIEKHIFSSTPIAQNVFMNKPNNIANNYADALWAFWPGVAASYGDILRAIETHEFLYQVMLKNVFIPESYSVHSLEPQWAQYVLRPEFAESTLFLYKLTKDRYYLNVARNIVNALEKYCKTKCGYASISDIRKMTQFDQMDSYFLAEMFKYLYLIFAENDKNDEKVMPLQLDDLEITTEAHFVPIIGKNFSKQSSFIYTCQSFKQTEEQIQKQATDSTNFSPHFDAASIRNAVRVWMMESKYKTVTSHENSASFSLTVIYNLTESFLADQIARFQGTKDHNGFPQTPIPTESPKLNLKTQTQENTSNNKNPIPTIDPDKLDYSNAQQLKDLSRMGITILSTKQGGIQLYHNPDSAESTQAGKLGQDFMIKVIELNNQLQQQLKDGAIDDFESKNVMAMRANDILDYFNEQILKEDAEKLFFTTPVSPALFGPSITDNPTNNNYIGRLRLAEPFDGCSALTNPKQFLSKMDQQQGILPTFLIVERGNCMFIQKTKNSEKIGAEGVIIIDNVENSSIKTSPLFQMSGDGKLNTTIPTVFMYKNEGDELINLMEAENDDVILMIAKKEVKMEQFVEKVYPFVEFEYSDNPGQVGSQKDAPLDNSA